MLHRTSSIRFRQKKDNEWSGDGGEIEGIKERPESGMPRFGGGDFAPPRESAEQ